MAVVYRRGPCNVLSLREQLQHLHFATNFETFPGFWKRFQASSMITNRKHILVLTNKAGQRLVMIVGTAEKITLSTYVFNNVYLYVHSLREAA